MNSPQLKPVEDRTLRAQIVEQLTMMVTNGVYAPGERLTENALAGALNVSRAPLREAIRALVDQGILVSQPYRGLFVRQVSTADIEDLYSMRIVLEQFAFRLAWARRTPDALADLKDRYRSLSAAQVGGDQAATIAAEVRFHSWVYEISGHSLLLAQWQRLKPLLQIYMSVHHKMHGSHGEFKHMTADYLKTASGKDIKRMMAHIEEHMRQGLDSVLTAVPKS